MKYNRANARFFSRLGHRGAFAMAVMELAEKDESLVVLTADLAALTGLERFRDAYPDRLINMGIAEQNMVSVAAAMSKAGMNVFATTYANFLTMRAYEQIRLNLGYMRFGVRLIGTGAGLSMAMSGNSHYSIEDVAIMRAIPNMTVIAPADGFGIAKATEAASSYPGPVYLRLTGVQGSPAVYQDDFDFQIGKAIELREGEDIGLIASGTMVSEALAAAGTLEESGLSVSVVDCHTIKPLDTDMVDTLIRRGVKLIVTIEEHSVIGGLGGAVAEYKATLENAPTQMMIGVEDRFMKPAEYRVLLTQSGLTAERISEKVLANWAKRGS